MVTAGGSTFEYSIGGGLRVSLQRYPQPAARGWIDTLPRSCGALPLFVQANGLVAACPAGEAFWLGLVPARGDSWTVRVEVSPATVARVESVRVPPAFAINGIVRDERTWWPFTRTSEKIDIHAEGPATSNAVRVEIVGADEFHRLTGELVPPLDPAASYQGWRLP